MKVSTSMYRALFNGITDALTALENGDADGARELLIYAQRRAEEIYIEGEGEPEPKKAAPKPLH